jgi:hypothetical protein
MKDKLIKNIFKSPFFYWVAVVIVFALGFLLRSHMILAGDFWFTPDQARDMILARDVVNFHKLILIGARSGVEGIFHGPLWIYLISVPFAIFNGDPQKVSYFYIFFSLVVLFSAFFAAYKLYNKWVALMVLIILSFANSLYMMINDTSNAHGLPLVLIGYLACMIYFIRGKDKAMLFAIFFAGLAFEFQAAFAIFLLPYTVLSAFIIRRNIFKIKNILSYVIVYAISLISLILFELRHQFVEMHAVLGMLFNPIVLKPMRGYEQYGNLWFRIQDRLTALLNAPYSFLVKQNAILYFLAIAVILFALYFIIKNNKQIYKKEYVFLLVFPFFVYFLYIIYPLPIWSHYTFAIPIIMAFLFVISSLIVWRTFWGKILIILFFIYSIVLAITNVLDMYKSEYVPVTDGSYINQLKLADGVFKQANGKEFTYFVYAPPVVTYGMDYLLWWRGKNVYKYFPVNVKKPGLMFLIMYPNDADKSAHAYWIKNKIKTTARILSTKIYEGNITVEERLLEKNEDPVDPNYYLNIR